MRLHSALYNWLNYMRKRSASGLDAVGRCCEDKRMIQADPRSTCKMEHGMFPLVIATFFISLSYFADLRTLGRPIRTKC